MADYWKKKQEELENEKKKASMDYWEKKEKELKEERKAQSKDTDRKTENAMKASASNVGKYTPSSYLQTLAVLEDLKLGGKEEERKKKEQEEGYKRRQTNTSKEKSEDGDIAPTPALMSSYGVTALKAQEDYLDLKAQKQAADQAEADRRKVMYSAALGDHSVQLSGAVADKKAYDATKKDDLLGMDFGQKGAFTDGYQAGDVTKTILGTLGDALTDLVKAPIRMGEGIGDALTYGAAAVGDALGYDEWADGVRDNAQESSTDKLFRKQDDFLDRYSVLGKTSDSLFEGVGQAATLVATGGLAGSAGLGTVGQTILTSGLVAGSGIGSGMSEAYQGGATDEEAALYGVTVGTAEAIIEMLSGGLGKASGAVGIGKGLGGIDDVVAEGLTRKINNTLVKNLTQAGIKAGGEGLEEVLSGITSAAMKKATYMSEEELSQLLSDENLLEQFVVGAMVSGVMQGGDVVTNTKAGRDMVTGLNQTEQTVVDRLYQDALKQAESDGKKLKGSEKTELYDGIVSDMEKGYLDKEKISEILGGEDYTAWKDAKSEEEGKLAELEELRGIKESELTVGQRERYDELKAEVESWKSGTYDESDHFISNRKSTELGAKLTSKVADMVKDTKLTETWKQDLMKREAFSADPSTYKNKSSRQTLENLVKSGVVNNSNRSHEMAETLANLSQSKGYVFDFTSNAKLKASGMVKEGTTVNGYISKDGKTITVNMDSPKAWQFIVGHEITHSLEGTAEYKEFKTLLMQYAQGQEGWDNYQSRVKSTFQTYDKAGIDVSSNADQMAGEITADLVGEYIFQDEAFVTELATKHRNVFRKIYDEIKHLIKMVTAGSKEAKDLERLHHAFEKAWAKGGTVSSYAGTSADTKPKVITEADVESAEPVSVELTEEQEEYFKDSKVRDENGNLKVMYHGTSSGGFTVFDPYGASRRGNLFGAGAYFTDDESVANGYTARGKGDHKQVYQTYLNITNPIDMDAIANVQEWEEAFPEADFPEVGTNEDYFRAVEEYMEGMEYSTAEAQEMMLDGLERMGYDGITHVGGDRVDADGKKHRVYIAFRPEQIKAIDNGKPTTDADIRYSLSDNAGRKLSDGQAKYFADSKVRDENGNLMVMYHGTPNGDFTVFRDGTYFTTDKSYADKYQNPGASSLSVKQTASSPKTYEVYLDIKKPFDLSDPEARAIYIDEYIKGGNAVGINPYLSDTEYAKISTIDWTEGEDLREFLQDNGYDYDGLVLDEGGVGGYGDAVQSRGTSYVVFSPEQVKNTDNLNPSGDRDIRFSLSKSVEETPELIALHNMQADQLVKSLELGGLPMPSIAVIKAEAGHEQYGDVSLILPKNTIDPKANKANKIYGADAWTPTYPKIEYKPSKAVADKISRKYYDLSRRIGYEETRPMSRYADDLEDALNRAGGENGLLARLYDDTQMMQVYLADSGKGKVETVMKETRTEMSQAEVEMNEYFINALGADVVDSVMTPEGVSGGAHRIEYWKKHGDQIKSAYETFLSEEYGFTAEEIENVLSGMRTFDFLKIVRDAHVYRKNGAVTTKSEPDNSATNEAIRAAAADGYKEWVDNLFGGIEEKSGIRNNADYFTNSGNRRSWDALHWENTLENVVRAMKAKDQTGADAIFGSSQLFAVAAKNYGSIAEVKADSDRLRMITEEEYEAIKKEYNQRMTDIAGRIADNVETNRFIAFDNALECIVDAVRKSKTVSGIYNYLRQYGQLNVTKQDAEDIARLVNDIANMPTGYFEAKPQRAVGFDEVGVFVIPNTADPKLKQELLNRGYSIAEYDPSVEGDRKRVVNGFEEYKFSLSDVSDMDNRIRGDFATPASSLAYRGESEGNASEIPNSSDVAPMPEATDPSAEWVSLRNELDGIEAQIEELTRGEYTAETYATFERLVNRGAELQKRMDEITASADEANAEALSSITDADAPPVAEEMDAPILHDEEVPDLLADREMKTVGNRKIKAYMYENPEVKPYFQAMANIMKTDLREGIKGEKWFNSKLYYETNGEAGWGGTTRALAQDLADLKDQYGYTYEELEKGVQAIIDDDGAENNAISKRLEFLIHDRLAYGYTDDWGQPMPEDAEYIRFIREKAITEYNEEAKKQFFEVADQYAPPAEEDLAPMPQSAPSSNAKVWADETVGMGDPDAVPEIAPVAKAPVAEAPKAKKAVSRKEVHAKFIGEAKSKLAESGLDFDAVLKGAKDLSTFETVDNTPQRVMEKALGYKAGRVLSDLTVNKVAQNETAGIRWLNRYTDRKSGVLAQISRQYRIKPGSKESAAAQMYAEGFYVNDKNEIIKYGESELAKDFPSLDTQNRIRNLATDPRIRKIYDETLKAINESRARNAYPEIPKLDNYFLHFRAMGDTFSKLGLPFNPNDIRAKDLPTDLNGVTADLKPGQPYFASAQHRTGKRTSFDLLGGLEMYLNSAKNQIYHIDDIQNLRAFRNYIADMYGQANGLEGLDDLGEAEQQERLAQVYGAHLSTFAKFLNEEANVIAGKTALIDRGLEGIIGRRGMTFLDSLNRQVGANMVGGNISSALTNFIAPIQAFAKTNKLAFIKAMAQFSSNKVASIFGKGDGFADQSPVMVRRNGIERFHRTLWQKMSDPGYLMMRAVDEVSTELIARAKYNEYTAKGMSAEQAHIEADKWTSRLMGDRSLGQQPQLYNSKMLGIVTKFQLEVRNQLDSQFYDTIQETKASNEDIKNGIARNARTAAQVTSTFVQLAVLQHIFGKAFESMAGYNPAFDIISAIVKAAGFDDEEEDEDTILDNLGQGLMELVEDLPYSSLMTGGRIPMASALPIKELFTGKDQYGNEKSRLETLSEAAPYYLMPGGYGQVKKTLGGMDMFSDEHPIAGSYTDSGNLRFPVADTPLNRVQAGLFGQWASGNARDYFDGERSALNPSQTQEFIDSGMSIQEYWRYRDGMKGMTKNAEKLSYINSLPLDEAQKNALKSHLFDEAAYKEENPERYAFFEDEGIGYLGYRQLDEETQQAWSWAYNHQDKYRYLKENGVMPEDYSVYHVPMLEFDDEADSAFEWAFNNPEKAVFGKVFSDGVREYRQYTSELSGIKANKDEGGKTISGSRKEKVLEYLNSLDIDYGERLILFKREYNADDTYNKDIIDYLNSREDISFEDTITILRELGFTVTDDGAISWD